MESSVDEARGIVVTEILEVRRELDEVRRQLTEVHLLARQTDAERVLPPPAR